MTSSKNLSNTLASNWRFLRKKIPVQVKFVIALFFFGLSGLQYTLIAQTPERPKFQMGKNQTTNYFKTQTVMKTQIKFVFQPLPYSYEALEPSIDKQTLEIHYGKHHKAYYDNFINAIKGTEMESMDIIDIFRNMSKYPMAVRNHRRIFWFIRGVQKTIFRFRQIQIWKWLGVALS